MVSFPRVLKTVRLPVTGCLTVAHSAGWLRGHFMYRHFSLLIAVVQEEKDMLPLCDLYGMHMPARWLIKHQRTWMCNRNMHIRWRRRYIVISSQCSEASFSLTGEYKAG